MECLQELLPSRGRREFGSCRAFRTRMAGLLRTASWADTRSWPTLAQTDFGQNRLSPKSSLICGVLCMVCGCLFHGFMQCGFTCGCWFQAGPPFPGPPLPGPPFPAKTALPRTAQNFALFISLWVCSLNSGGVFEGRDPQMHVWVLWLSCEAPAASGPPFSTLPAHTIGVPPLTASPTPTPHLVRDHPRQRTQKKPGQSRFGQSRFRPFPEGSWTWDGLELQRTGTPQNHRSVGSVWPARSSHHLIGPF